MAWAHRLKRPRPKRPVVQLGSRGDARPAKEVPALYAVIAGSACYAFVVLVRTLTQNHVVANPVDNHVHLLR